MSAKLTPWFPGSVPPAHPGVYEWALGIPQGLFKEWTGSQWLLPRRTARAAARERTVSIFQPFASSHCCFRWRGLHAKPENKPAPDGAAIKRKG